MVRPTIYTAGDSHGWHGWLHIPNVSTNYISGPMTMHSFNILMEKPNSHLATVPSDSILCFCFGEIDCRCHVHRFQPWEKTIDILVENYAKSIVNSTVGRDPKFIWVYFIPPPLRNPIADSEGFPFCGTVDERITYVKYMNKKLKELPYTFIDLYDKYCNEDGSMIYEYSDGHVHIAKLEPLKEWIDNELLRTFTE